MKFSLDRARAADSTNAQKGLFEPIESVEVVDHATVKVTLKRPTGSFLYNMGWAAAVIVAPATAADNKTSRSAPARSSSTSGARARASSSSRTPTYWGKPVKLDKAIFKSSATPTASFAAMMAGDVDAFPIYPAPENLDQFRADPRFKVVVGNTEGETILAMNNGKKPFDDIRVRQALSMAVDRKAIIDGAMYGIGKPIGSHFAPQDPGYVDLTGPLPLRHRRRRRRC